MNRRHTDTFRKDLPIATMPEWAKILRLRVIAASTWYATSFRATFTFDYN